MMEKNNAFIVGFFVLVVLTASVYVMLPNQIRIDVQNTKTTFKVYENNFWILSGTEYTKIYDGSSLMKANSRVVNYTINNLTNSTSLYRYAYFKDGIVVIDNYNFDGNVKNVELMPISHTIQVINGDGKILQYEVNDLLYTGNTINNINSPQTFGHKMKVEWELGNYYSQIFKYSGKDVGKLTIKYKINSDDYSKNVRFFDPVIVTSGATETTAGNYTVLTYLGNGTFNVTGSLNVRVLIVAGGGGGGYSSDHSGGGGGGGLLEDNSYFVNGNMNITVGVGGAGATSGLSGGNGQNSSFGNTTALGGGGGASYSGAPLTGSNGGSGGGGSTNFITWGYGGSGILGQGNAGGNGGTDGSTWAKAGGGGGAGLSGGNATSAGAAGGDGLSSTIYNGTSLWYSGGGGAGLANGKGGGGAANTGGGGEKGAVAGGSGIVIIRYLRPLVNITINSPANYLNTTNPSVIFNVTVSDNTNKNLTNATLYIDNALNETNTSGQNVTSKIYIFTKILSEGSHNWSILVFDTDNLSKQSETRFLTVDKTSPKYYSNSTSNTVAGYPIIFSINVTDNIALHPDGQYIFSTNNSFGNVTFVNDSSVNLTAISQWANVTKTANSTVGRIVGYRWYFKDNVGNLNSTPVYIINLTTFHSVEISANLSSGITIFYFNATNNSGIFQPFGQTSTKGIINVTNNYTIPVNVYMNINETHSCITDYANDVYDFSTAHLLITNYTQIRNSGLAVNQSCFIWMWTRYQCNASTEQWEPLINLTGGY